jgi:hypothetical protein
VDGDAVFGNGEYLKEDQPFLAFEWVESGSRNHLLVLNG